MPPYTVPAGRRSGFLIGGDAAATLDPLSSFGVKKAVASGWVAAVVVNTCLRRPEMEVAALQFFEEREREVFESVRQALCHLVWR